MTKNFKEICSDVKKAFEIILDDNNESFNYRKIYPCSNENLIMLFDKINIYGKKVLSVLSSSDQYFTLKYLGAETVDTFDINKLTYYYYFLRKWNIDYYNSEYIDLKGNKDNILNLLDYVNPISYGEVDALLFWRMLLDKTDNISDLFRNSKSKKSYYFDDLKSLKNSLIKPLKFKCIDFYEELYLDKKYDLIVLSNILEYGNLPIKYDIARKNIEKLLTDDGICLCSHLIDKKGSYINDLEVKIITKNNLEYEDLNLKYIDSKKRVKEVGYVYKKRG